MSANLPRFISEKEVTERRLRNEAEGIKEEPYDPRSLYDRLQAEKARKQEEYETNAAFKNQIHRLDPDEAEFLAKVEEKKYNAQEFAEHEADMLIKEAKAANRSILVKVTTERSTAGTVVLPRRPTSSSSSTLDQRRLMSGIKRKSVSNSDQDPKRLHTSSPEPNELSEQVESNPKVAGSMTTETGPVEARVLAGFLPGLDVYTGSSSDSSSDSSTDVEDSAQTLDVIAVTRTKSASSGGE